MSRECGPTRYAIDWGNGSTTVVGENRKYAEQLLRESSGPFSAFLPAPSVVEVAASGCGDPTCTEAHP